MSRWNVYPLVKGLAGSVLLVFLAAQLLLCLSVVVDDAVHRLEGGGVKDIIQSRQLGL